jgi:SHS2 domain-containing protein
MMTEPRYQTLSHTADTGIVTRADTLADVIANAAFAMFDLVYDTVDATSERNVDFVARADNAPDLLVEVLTELLYLSETEDVAFAVFDVRAEVPRAVVSAVGFSTADVELRGPPIKAVTYHDLRCEQVGDLWEAQVIFDV